MIGSLDDVAGEYPEEFWLQLADQLERRNHQIGEGCQMYERTIQGLSNVESTLRNKREMLQHENKRLRDVLQADGGEGITSAYLSSTSSSSSLSPPGCRPAPAPTGDMNGVIVASPLGGQDSAFHPNCTPLDAILSPEERGHVEMGKRLLQWNPKEFLQDPILDGVATLATALRGNAGYMPLANQNQPMDRYIGSNDRFSMKEMGMVTMA